jgi:hypothetical protein
MSRTGKQKGLISKVVGMFTEENTEGFSKVVLDGMNAELKEALKEFEFGTQEYYKEEKRASEEILKKYDAQLCEVIDFFFTKN